MDAGQAAGQLLFEAFASISQTFVHDFKRDLEQWQYCELIMLNNTYLEHGLLQAHHGIGIWPLVHR